MGGERIEQGNGNVVLRVSFEGSVTVDGGRVERRHLQVMLTQGVKGTSEVSFDHVLLLDRHIMLKDGTGWVTKRAGRPSVHRGRVRAVLREHRNVHRIRKAGS